MPKAKARECIRCHASWVRTSRSESLRLCPACCASHGWCVGCQDPRPIADFTQRSQYATGRSKYCRSCERGQKLLHRYGITLQAFKELVEKQDSRCGACGERQDETDFVVDHSHSTGEVRGLLCGNCNLAIGHLRDSVLNALGVARYLESFCAAA